MADWRIPLSDLDFGPEEEAAVIRVLRGRWLSMGPEVQAFEREFAEYIGTRHAVAVANGTAALHLTYLALGLGPGDEVIQPAINFVASANMTVAVGATPIFADIIGPVEPTIDPAEIDRKITPHTRAVVVMHYGGYPCRMADIHEICTKHGLPLIEDACHALGARYTDSIGRPPNGRKVGQLADAGCFSFFSNKNLVTGEGGMITTDRDDLAEQLRLLRSHGMSSLTWDRHRGHANSYDVTMHGYNYRLDEIRAALGRRQLLRLDGNNIRRSNRAATYRARLTNLPGWIVPFDTYTGSSSFHLMVAVAPDVATRAEIAGTLQAAGIQSSRHYPCISDFQAFAHLPTDDLNQSRSFAARAITLPLFSTMTLENVEAVCANVENACLTNQSVTGR